MWQRPSVTFPTICLPLPPQKQILIILAGIIFLRIKAVYLRFPVVQCGYVTKDYNSKWSGSRWIAWESWEGRFKGADLASRGFFFWFSPLDTRLRWAGLNFRNHLRPLGNPENESNCLANGTKITSWVSLMTPWSHQTCPGLWSVLFYMWQKFYLFLLGTANCFPLKAALLNSNWCSQ